MEECIDIIVQYLKYYRDQSFLANKKLHPFERAAIESVIQESDFHPRRFLSRLRRIITQGLGDDVRKIDQKFVETIPEIEEEEELPSIEELQLVPLQRVLEGVFTPRC